MLTKIIYSLLLHKTTTGENMKEIYKHGTIRLCGDKRVEFERILIEVNARRQAIGKNNLTRSDLINLATQSLNLNKAVKYEP
jgi:hypothetical protein